MASASNNVVQRLDQNIDEQYTIIASGVALATALVKLGSPRHAGLADELATYARGTKRVPNPNNEVAARRKHSPRHCNLWLCKAQCQCSAAPPCHTQHQCRCGNSLAKLVPGLWGWDRDGSSWSCSHWLRGCIAAWWCCLGILRLLALHSVAHGR